MKTNNEFIRESIKISPVKLDFSKIEKKTGKFPIKQLKNLRKSYEKALNTLQKKALNDSYVEQRIAANFNRGK